MLISQMPQFRQGYDQNSNSRRTQSSRKRLRHVNTIACLLIPAPSKPPLSTGNSWLRSVRNGDRNQVTETRGESEEGTGEWTLTAPHAWGQGQEAKKLPITSRISLPNKMQ